MTAGGPAPGEGHEPALDGLRFLAAAIVLNTHAWAALAKPAAVDASAVRGPWVLAISAASAVDLFFVLSGYCLAGSAGRIRGAGELFQFYVRRYFRIQPPYVFALLVAWLASIGADPQRVPAGVSSWGAFALSVHLAPARLVRHLGWPGAAEEQLGPGWTLAVEMGLSLLLPLLVWLSRRVHLALLVAASLVLLVRPVGPEFLYLPYTIAFVLGIAIHQRRDALREQLLLLPRGALWGLVALGLLLFGAQRGLGFDRTLGGERTAEGLLLGTLAGAALLLAVLGLPALRRALAGRRLAVLGRASYSFYLLHFPLLLLALRGLARPVGAVQGLALWLLVLAASMAASLLAWRFVERPAIRAGNALCALIARRSGRPAQLSRLIG